MTEKEKKGGRVIIPSKKSDYSDAPTRPSNDTERKGTVITDTNPPPKPPEKKKE